MQPVSRARGPLDQDALMGPEMKEAGRPARYRRLRRTSHGLTASTIETHNENRRLKDSLDCKASVHCT